MRFQPSLLLRRANTSRPQLCRQALMIYFPCHFSSRAYRWVSTPKPRQLGNSSFAHKRRVKSGADCPHIWKSAAISTRSATANSLLSLPCPCCAGSSLIHCSIFARSPSPANGYTSHRTSTIDILPSRSYPRVRAQVTNPEGKGDINDGLVSTDTRCPGTLHYCGAINFWARTKSRWE